MLVPRKVKYRKQQRGKMKGIAFRGCNLEFGDFALQASTGGWVNSKQLEAGRIAITRCLKKGGKVWIRVFPDKPITKKPAETRMGKGKGGPVDWVAVIHPGRIIYEMEGVSGDLALEALRLASHKLPLRTKILSRSGIGTEQT